MTSFLSLARTRSLLLCLLVTALAGAGCGNDKKPGTDGGPGADTGVPDDGSMTGDDAGDSTVPGEDPDKDTGLTDEPLEWTSTGTTTSGGVVVETITYQSHGLTIKGEICRPDDNAVHPYLVYDHGGFIGMTVEDHAYCKELAGPGYGFVVVASEYRGEGGSDGEVEICNGEADDVRRLDAIARVKLADRIDLDHAGVIGISHGGCITMRAVLKGLDVDTVVNVYGLGDLKENYTFLKQILADYGDVLNLIVPQGQLLVASINALLARIEVVTGGLPDSTDAEVNAEYYARSPVLRAGKLANKDFDFLVLHGLKDYIVPFEPNCVLAHNLGDVEAWHITAPLVGDPAIDPSPPANCGLSGIHWNSNVAPTTNFGSRTFLFFDGGAHTFGDQFDAHQGPLLKAASFGFLKAKLQ